MNRPFIVRREQVEALAESRRDAFVKKLARKLKETFPEKASPLGDSGVLTVAKAALDHARAYGFSAEKHIAIFAALELTLGDDFLERPEYGGARGVLRGGWVATPDQRMNALLREISHSAGDEATDEQPQPPER